MKKILLVGCFVIAPMFAADVAGNWKLSGKIGDNPLDLTCSMKQASDNKLTGTCNADQIGELAITGETNDKNVKWSYKVNYQGQEMTVVYSGTLESPTSMKGAISVMDQPAGNFTATKQ
ncbi:MAG: hypothetical protein ACRD30_05975 [Bryobacteraceae bacterium]